MSGKIDRGWRIHFGLPQRSAVFTLLPALSPGFKIAAQILIGSVWVFHGFYSKILNGIPRHRMIVGKILGAVNAGWATKTIGALEIFLGVWAFSGWHPVPCAAVQTAAILSMNTLEIVLARELLVSSIGMVALNAGFLSAVWYWAFSFPRT
jgi:hypothetical protein